MKRLLLALAATLPAAAAGAAPFTFGATLGPEAPGAQGSGTARVVLDPVANTLVVSTSWSGLSGTTTMAHIHCCTAQPFTGTAIPATRASAPGFPDFPTGVQAGSYSRSFDTADPATWNPNFITASGGTLEAAEARLLEGLQNGTAYLNIHTTLFPGGEIRGFFAPVPTPVSLALFGVALAGLAAARRAAA